MKGDNYWQFRYRKGPATVTSHVQADSKEEAEEVARMWCSGKEGLIFCAVLDPFCVADKTILPKAEKVKVG